jgi:hypothetical protein
MSEPESAPPFITFYSFKGGVGRSMAAINVAGILASRGFRVLVIDMDLEAPGLSFLANAAQADEPRVTQLGFVDFMLDAVRSGADADFSRWHLRRLSPATRRPTTFHRNFGARREAR